jgi:DnaD/phage-associated family protein
MAEYRQVHTIIWEDDWFIELTPEEKVVWFWLITNRRASVSGLYELSYGVIARETAFAKDMIIKIIDKFQHQEKIVIDTGWIWVINLRKYNDSKTDNCNKRIEADLLLIPEELRTAYEAYYKPLTSPLQAPDKVLEEIRNKKEEIGNKEIGKTQSVFSVYENNIGMLTPIISDKLIDAEKEFGPAWICDAIEEAVKANVRKWNYIRGILDNWKVKGRGDNRNKPVVDDYKPPVGRP